MDELLQQIGPAIDHDDRRLLKHVHSCRLLLMQKGVDLNEFMIALRDQWPDSDLAFDFAKLILEPT